MIKKHIILTSGFATTSYVWDNIIACEDFCKSVIFCGWEELLSQEKKPIEDIFTDKHKEVFIVAWSLGAMLMINYIIQNNYKINGMVIIGATQKMLKEDTLIGYTKTVFNSMKKKLLDNRAEFLQDFFSNVLHCNTSNYLNKEKLEEKEYEITQLLKESDIFSNQQLMQGLEIIETIDLRSKLGTGGINIKKERANKIIHLHGEQDKIIPIANALQCWKESGIETRRVLNCGHYLIKDKTEIVTGAILEIINHNVKEGCLAE